MNNPLTDQQAAILTAIRKAMETRGFPPSVSELGRAVGLASDEAVAKQIRLIAFKGYIKPIPGTSAVEILDPQETPR